MSRPAHSVVNALTVVSCLSGSLAIATELTPDEANTPLTAVSKRGPYVFASTPDGLFRAPLETKRWERLKTPPEMPPNGTFAVQPGGSPLVIYVALWSKFDHQTRRGSRYGLYLSHDNGATWELVSERDDFGATLLHPSGALFAVTGADGVNQGDRLLRSPDLGKTWRDITGTARAQFMGLEPDPNHPGLVRIHAWAIRTFMLVAADENYRWKTIRGTVRAAGRRPSIEFFKRESSSSTTLYLYPATLSNYFKYDFGNRKDAQALEVVPLKTRFEFARGARAVVPVRVVFHFDPDAALAHWRKSAAEGRPYPKPTPPTVKFADQPGGADFWGLRVESSDDQVESYPTGRVGVTTTVTTTSDGKTVTSTHQPAAVKYRVVDLSPSSPYEREIDLGRLSNFSKPGEYRVQILYGSGGHPDREKGEWGGSFTSPVFTVVIRE
jgi:hypothetical protein